MRTHNSSAVMAHLNIQRALLGEISGKMRAVTFSESDALLTIRIYFDSAIESDDLESASCIETEVIADYDEGYTVELKCIRLDAPEPVLDDGAWVFKRREM